MKINLNRIILFVANVETLKDFYVNVLHLDIVEEIKNEWLVLRAGPCELALHKMGDEYKNSAEVSAKSGSNTKIVFDIDEDIFSFADKLREINMTITEVKTWENFDYWLCDGQDPEGNIFQLRQKRPA